ncbi:minichromosome maintenance protein MCM [Halobellus rufus]|uniref:minichromosome maintenance protein MCM n=1 Tax=Halobellus rufus TaxID=1448860 RepID=UPI0006784496|nr:minichromosome maintenance protein MCM [Halobellus rufus]
MVTIDKAGISADLPTRTALLASGNPIHGRFDRHEPIAGQIDMDDALIDRMDVLLAVRDIPDPEMDADVADHVLGTFDEAARKELADQGIDVKEPETTTVDPPVPTETFTAMLVYARENVFPLPTEEAKEMLKESYVEVRDLNDNEDDPVSATPRRIEAGLRLAIGFARAELSETVEPRHAERAIKITKNVVGLNFDPETGKFDADRTGKGTPQNQRDRIKALTDIISELETREEPADIDDILTVAQEELDLSPTKVDDELEKMSRKGNVYHPDGDGSYRVS